MRHQLTPDDTDFEPTAKQRAVVVRYSAPPWPSFSEAARLEGIPVDTAKNWRSKGKNAAAFVEYAERVRKEALAELTEAVNARIMQLGNKALEVIEQDLEAEDPRVRSQNARWTLEQIIGKARERLELAEANGKPVEFTIAIDNPADEQS